MIRKVDYWRDFPEPGTGILLDVVSIGLFRFAGILEAKREEHGELELVAYLINKSLADPLKTFQIKAKRSDYVRDGDFDADKARVAVASQLSEALISADLATANGIVDSRVNEWVDRIKGDKRALVEEIATCVSLQAVKNKVKLAPSIKTTIRVASGKKKV